MQEKAAARSAHDADKVHVELLKLLDSFMGQPIGRRSKYPALALLIPRVGAQVRVLLLPLRLRADYSTDFCFCVKSACTHTVLESIGRIIWPT